MAEPIGRQIEASRVKHNFQFSLRKLFVKVMLLSICFAFAHYAGAWGILLSPVVLIFLFVAIVLSFDPRAGIVTFTAVSLAVASGILTWWTLRAPNEFAMMQAVALQLGLLCFGSLALSAIAYVLDTAQREPPSQHHARRDISATENAQIDA